MKTESAKHTPGPWEAYIENDEKRVHQSYIHATRNETKFAIGEIFATTVRGEVKANARLIAAAPELYETARAAWMDATVATYPDLPASQITVNKAKWFALVAAIAKAEGR